jgi:hypothetical protein
LVLYTAAWLSHATNNDQDWWWNPAQSGMTLSVVYQGDGIAMA